MSQERKKQNRPKSSRSRNRRRKVRIYRICVAGVILLTILLIVGAVKYRTGKPSGPEGRDWEKEKEKIMENPSFPGAPVFDVELLDVNEYSRPGIPLDRVKGIVVHYTANPGSTAMENRNYFENLKDSHETKVSSHFVIGIEGEIVQCIPSTEMAYASNSRNGDTLSIECCHKDETGAFTKETYRSLVRLTGWLCQHFGLTEEDVIRHYDVTGKICPKYFVDHPEEWEAFKTDVKYQIELVEEVIKEKK